MSRATVDLDEVRFRGSDEALAQVEVVYKRDVFSQALSDELVFAIRAVARDCQSVLDATTTRIKKKYLKTSDWRCWFPVSADPAEFRKKLERQLPGLSIAQPTITAAFERHQPYQPGNTELGYLYSLAHANRCSDFSPHRRLETVEIESVPGGGFTVSVVDGFAATASESNGVRYMTRAVLIGWNFVDPPEPVLPTLRALVRQTSDAVTDISREAGL